MVKKSLCGLSAEDIFRIIEPSGFKYSHAVDISNNIYKKRITDISSISKIPKKLKDLLSENSCIGIFPPVASEVSIDKTVKYLFRSEEGKMFETVFIPENKRNTVCISSQSGCRMGCSFCATSGYGFHGDLSAGEIVNQVLSIPGAEKITHVVFMGMGEPLDNIDNVLKACAILTSEWGLAISPRNVTVSTVGITRGIENYLRSCECNLTLSLLTPFSEERKFLVPAEKNNQVSEILELLKNYPVKKKRRISLAYVMIKDLNDTVGHLAKLKDILAGSKIRVNLLRYHNTGNDLNASSSEEAMMFFKHNLVVSGISASIRKSRGIDISAACGLLATRLK